MFIIKKVVYRNRIMQVPTFAIPAGNVGTEKYGFSTHSSQTETWASSSHTLISVQIIHFNLRFLNQIFYDHLWHTRLESIETLNHPDRSLDHTQQCTKLYMFIIHRFLIPPQPFIRNKKLPIILLYILT